MLDKVGYSSVNLVNVPLSWVKFSKKFLYGVLHLASAHFISFLTLLRDVAYQNSIKHIFYSNERKSSQFVSQFCDKFPGCFWAVQCGPDPTSSNHVESCCTL